MYVLRTIQNTQKVEAEDLTELQSLNAITCCLESCFAVVLLVV